MIGNVISYKKNTKQSVFYKSFISNDLKPESELEILNSWLQYIQKLKKSFQTNNVRLYRGDILKKQL